MKIGLLCFCERKMQAVAPYLVVKLREGVAGKAAPPDLVVDQTEVKEELLTVVT